MKISDNLKANTLEIKTLKSLFQKEQNYLSYLKALEYGITIYFSTVGVKISDKEIITALENIRDHPSQEINQFKNELEQGLAYSLNSVLSEKPITFHEFKLVIKYILWSIDNRSWLDDEQAYLKWIKHFFGLMKKDEEKRYRSELGKIARENGLGERKFKCMLGEREGW